jgi:hypothetical protein
MADQAKGRQRLHEPAGRSWDPAPTRLTCPHLGMRDDPGAYFSYPSSGNRCHHCRRPETPSLAHQEAVCLQGRQHVCPAFNQDSKRPFPGRLRQRSAVDPHGSAVTAWLPWILLFLIAIGFLEWWFFPKAFALAAGWP